MKRWFFNLAAGISLALCVVVCVLWVRGRTGLDEASWTFDRYLADGSAASNQVYLTSNKRLWLQVNWGHVGPYNGQLVWGYYVSADLTGGRPRLRFRHQPHEAKQDILFANVNPDNGTSGFGPLRWQTASRSKAKEGDDFRFVQVGISHWLLVALLLATPISWLYKLRHVGDGTTPAMLPSRRTNRCTLSRRAERFDNGESFAAIG